MSIEILGVVREMSELRTRIAELEAESARRLEEAHSQQRIAIRLLAELKEARAPYVMDQNNEWMRLFGITWYSETYHRRAMDDVGRERDEAREQMVKYARLLYQPGDSERPDHQPAEPEDDETLLPRTHEDWDTKEEGET